MARWLILVMVLVANMATAQPYRIATFNIGLGAKGPGVLLKRIASGTDPQVLSVARIIKTLRPDILLINELDHDYENRALMAFLAELNRNDGPYKAILYPYFFAPPQNTGVPSGLDLNGDGKLGGPADAFGYGRFRGQYAMALVSRFPIDNAAAQDWGATLWQKFAPEDLPKYKDGRPFPSEQAQAAMRFSSKSHWIVPVTLPDGRILKIMASHPTPPVFDGPEDMNGKRNKVEIEFWQRVLTGGFSLNQASPNNSTQNKPIDFVILGDLNSDPFDGDSDHATISALLSNPLLQDPQPKSNGAVVAARDQGGANAEHQGDPALDTTDWRDAPGPGNLRVDYVLPARNLTVRGAGVFWPAPDEPGFELIGSDGRTGSDHRLVWVDLE